MRTRIALALADACSLTAQSSQVVELGSPDATSLNEIDVVYDGCMKREDSFYADSKARLSYCDGFACAPMFTRNHYAFKSLQSLFGLGLFNPHVNTDRIAWLKLWNVLAQLTLFNLVQSIHFSMLLISIHYFSRSGRLRLVLAIAASLRQRSISA